MLSVYRRAYRQYWIYDARGRLCFILAPSSAGALDVVGRMYTALLIPRCSRADIIARDFIYIVGIIGGVGALYEVWIGRVTFCSDYRNFRLHALVYGDTVLLGGFIRVSRNLRRYFRAWSVRR